MAEVFVDTSAIYAALVVDDLAHPKARATLVRLEQDRTTLVTSSFVVQETVALLQSRSGLEAVQRFHEAVMPLLKVVWVSETQYNRGMAALLAASSRRVSLTDWLSFEVMRDLEIEQAFAFDRHFSQRGFEVLPES